MFVLSLRSRAPSLTRYIDIDHKLQIDMEGIFLGKRKIFSFPGGRELRFRRF